MKKLILILICITFIFSFSIFTYAHPGSLDSNGGHYNRSTGEYHYHHGYNAHQHHNGICPYDFDDKINDIYSSSSPSKTYNEIAEQKNDEKPSFYSVFFGYVALSFGILWIIAYIAAKRSTAIKTKRKEQTENSIYSHYFSMYAFYHPLDFVQVPEGSFLKHGLPATKGKGKYGDYTVYITPKGKCFHQNLQCSNNLKTSNYVYVHNRSPCKRCIKNKLPEIQWYLDAVKIIKIKKDYNIP